MAQNIVTTASSLFMQSSGSFASSGAPQSFGLFAGSATPSFTTPQSSGLSGSLPSFGLFTASQQSSLFSTSQPSGFVNASQSFASTPLFGLSTTTQSHGLFTTAQQSAFSSGPMPSGLFSASQSLGLFGKSQPVASCTASSSSRPQLGSLSSLGQFGQAIMTETNTRQGLFQQPPSSSSFSFQQNYRLQEESNSAASASGFKNVNVLFGKPTPAFSNQKPINEIDSNKKLLTMASKLSDDKEHDSDYDEELNSPTSSVSDGRKTIRRSISVENTVIVVRCLPDSISSNAIIRKLFSKFGDIAKVFVNARQRSASIHFLNHESAAKAKRLGSKLPGCQSVQIFFKASSTPRSERSSSTSLAEKSSKKSIKDDMLEATTSAASELEQELASMQGASNTDDIVVLKRKMKSSTAFGSPRESKGRSILRRRNADAETSPGKSSAAVAGPDKAAEKASVKLFLSNAVGHTAGEKYTVLEERDKILRNARKASKPANLVTAQAILGTCSDMCPEKERYMREDRRRLSIYEIVPGTDMQPGRNPQVNHARAVKEYSRSSADQDMPLPTELRPPEVLNRTMNYLLNNIIDGGGPGKWGDWFDFLWNRTRSIRKDITQQQLCDLTAVSLVEKCARFHIFCSEALCEEDVTIFEPKINNENLTKCLQTLKELYSDLRVKQNIFCPKEAEFRAYMVLMNLNQGDILREVQQLRTEVRESQEVKFAVEVYWALNSNNYVRFFKLVRQATFLASCILHRYFNQIRACALQRILRAYLVQGHSYHLSELTRLLAFEDDAEAKEFCEHHGVNFTADCQIHDRARFIDPEVAFASRRALNLIHGKHTKSLGEAINGSPVPPDVVREPTTSFDANGRFVCEGNDLGATSSVESAVHPTVFVAAEAAKLKQVERLETAGFPDVCAEVTATVAVAPPVVLSNDAPAAVDHTAINEIIKDITKELFLEVIREECSDISVKLVNLLRLFNVAEPVCQEIIDEYTNASMKLVAAESLNECVMLAKELHARERALHAASSDRVGHLLVADFVDVDVASMSREIASGVYNQLSYEKAVDIVANDVLGEVLLSVTTRESGIISKDFYENDVVKRLQLFQKCSHALELWRMRKVFGLWKMRLNDHRKLKLTMETFPSVPSLQSWNRQFSRLIPDSSGVSIQGASLHIGNKAHVTLRSPDDVITIRQQLLSDVTEMKLARSRLEETAWCAINIAETIASCIPQASHKCNKIYWKLVLLEPLLDYCDNNRYYVRWLKAKLSKGTVPNKSPNSKVEVCSLYSTDIHDTSVGVCALSIASDIDAKQLQEQRHLMGTSAIAFVVSCNSTSTALMWKRESERLRTLLAAKLPVPRTPLLVLCFGISENATETVSNELRLEQLVASEVVSEFRIFMLDSDVVNGESSSVLCNAIRWLWEQSVTQCPVIKSTSLYDFVEDGLTSHFIVPVLQIVAERRKQGFGHLDPCLLVQWYNDLIDWLADMATHPELGRLSWPAFEFRHANDDVPADLNWNTDASMSSLRTAITSLTLSEMDCTPQTELWSAATEDVWYYVMNLVNCRNWNASQLCSKIKHVLERTEMEFQKLVQYAMASGHYQPTLTYACMPWADIIIACVEYQLTQLSPHQEFGDGVSCVHFLPDVLRKHPPPALPLPNMCMDTTVEVQLAESMVRSAVKRKQDVGDQSTVKQRRDDHPHSVIDVANGRTSQPNGVVLCFSPEDYRHEQRSADSRHAEMTEKVQQLQRFLDMERTELQSFETYLNDVVSAGESTVTTGVGFDRSRNDFPACPNDSQSSDHRNSTSRDRSPLNTSRELSITDRIERLNDAINSEKDADRLFEIQLMNVLLT